MLVLGGVNLPKMAAPVLVGLPVLAYVAVILAMGAEQVVEGIYEVTVTATVTTKVGGRPARLPASGS